MKVTVVIRTYNRPGFLIEALASVELQTHQDWEIIIFDDGALPDTFKVYSNFKTNHPEKNILYLTGKTNYQMYKDSWLLAPKLAKGEIIVRFDDDDIIPEDCLEYISQVYSSHPKIDYTFGSSFKFDVNNIYGKIIARSPLEVPRTKDAWAAYTIENNHPWREPWQWYFDYYDKPQPFTSIIHCSKANKLCSYALYTMRTKSLLKIIDKILPSNFPAGDDLEMMGTFEYLGLKYAPIKKILCYVRDDHKNRQTHNAEYFRKIVSKVRDWVEYYRPNNFTAGAYKDSGRILDNVENYDYHKLNNNFKLHWEKIKKISKTYI